MSCVRALRSSDDGTSPGTVWSMSDPRLTGTQIHADVLATIGNTPLVALPQLMAAECLQPLVAMKMEQTNPGGSSKDRPALQMLRDAEKAGELRPGMTIVEPTSGNTGVGLAIAAAQLGYRTVFVVTDKVAPEKISLLRAYGSEVVVCPVAVAPDDERSYYKTAERLTRELGAFRPNQYANPSNPLAHELTTGPEIWAQTAGRITHFVAGAGTSGTVTGVARFLKAQNPSVRIVVGDPDRSLFSGGSGRPYLVEGVGEDFYPAAWQPDLYDEVIPVTDKEAFEWARRFSRMEGILIGGSGGLAVAAAVHLARRCGPDDLIVILNPDSGRGYLSRVFDDAWMSRNGFLAADGPVVGDLLDRDRPVLSVTPSDTVGHAVQLMKQYNVSQLPVCQDDAPWAPSEIKGAVHEASLLAGRRDHADWFDRPVDQVMSQPLATIGVGEPVHEAARRLENANALMVLDGGRSAGVISRTDLLAWYEGGVVR